MAFGKQKETFLRSELPTAEHWSCSNAIRYDRIQISGHISKQFTSVERNGFKCRNRM